MNDLADKDVKIDLSHYHNVLSCKHQLLRLVWGLVWPLVTWFLPRSVGMPWKRMWLRVFGAQIASTANVYSTAKVYFPANLEMDEYSCLAQDVDCYNVDKVTARKLLINRGGIKEPLIVFITALCSLKQSA